MKKVLLIGAGKSSGYLIDYLLSYAVNENFVLTVADLSEASALLKTKGLPNSQAIALDINNAESRLQYISEADIVISTYRPKLPHLMKLPLKMGCCC